MTFINGLPENEREALEQGFREHLTAAVPAMIAKRFEGGASWCSDPIIRAAAQNYIAELTLPPQAEA